MSYQVLARKYRPRSFETMIGQEHVLRALINALDKQRLHHAYLFTGTRGVGKTSIARIIAKCLNCEKGISSKPCGQCSACQEIDGGNFVDLIEVDAASRTKVEDTRELLDNVQYLPTRGRFKIYLIDEVHMLSGHSFNALLKTLEEPPTHVKFLLATTDPQKLPVTVLSRCLQFHLKNLPPERITHCLQHVLHEENLKFEEEALNQIARAADGSVRDALSLLDQAIAFTQGEINTIDVSAMLGTIEQTHIKDLLRALAAQNGKQLLAITAQLAEHAADFGNALEELISFLHQIAIAQIIPEAIDQNDIVEFSKKFSREDVQLYYQIALIGRRDLPLASDPKSGFEMILLRMLAFRPVTRDEKPEGKIQNQEPKTKNPKSEIVNQQSASISNKSEQKKSSQSLQHTQLSTATSPLISSWHDFLPQLNLNGMVYALASNCALQSAADNRIELVLNKNHSALLNDKLKLRLNDAINQHLNLTAKVVINLVETAKETPAEILQKQLDTKHKAAIETIVDDPNIQEMVEKLGAIVEPSLVKAE